MPWPVLPAPSRPRAKKKGADHRPRARPWPGCVGRGTGGASNCSNGPNYGPATAKSAQMDLARGFARWLLRDDPDTDDGIFSVRLSIPMVGLMGGGEGRWVPGSGMHRKVVPLRTPTWAGRGNGKHEHLRVSARSDAAYRDERAPPDPPQHTQRQDPALTSTCRRAWSEQLARDDGR